MYTIRFDANVESYGLDDEGDEEPAAEDELQATFP
jgi:hypothetical protein